MLGVSNLAKKVYVFNIYYWDISVHTQDQQKMYHCKGKYLRAYASQCVKIVVAASDSLGNSRGSTRIINEHRFIETFVSVEK
jgi:hypothetical protein